MRDNKRLPYARNNPRNESHTIKLPSNRNESYHLRFQPKYSETSIKRTPSGPSQVIKGVRLVVVVKIAQCLLTINTQRLLCLVIKFHVVK